MTKRVLIIAHLYHASPRIPNLARHLSTFGWDPVIVTAPLSSWGGALNEPATNLSQHIKLLETEYYEKPRDVKGLLTEVVRSRVKRGSFLWYAMRIFYRIFTRVYRFFKSFYLEWRWYPDEEREWLPSVLDSVGDLLTKESFDAIISSSSPVSAHIAASQISVDFSIPWIADLRDLWTQNHNYSHSLLRRWVERKLEKRTLSKAAAHVTISDPWVTQLHTLHRLTPGYSITNGFDPIAYQSPPKLVDRFTITYTGQIYPAQHPSILFDAVAQLLAESVIDPSRFVIRFFGPKSPPLQHYANLPNLRSIIELPGVLPFESIAPRQMESHLLLLLNWGNPRGNGCYSGKVFEYLGAKRPIIAVGGTGNDVVNTLLKKTKSGSYCSSIADTKTSITAFYQEYEKTRNVVYRGIDSEINLFRYPELARQYASLLDDVRLDAIRPQLPHGCT